MIKKRENLFKKLVETEYLFSAWQRFHTGKSKRLDIQAFAVNLEKNIFKVQRQLIEGSYKHSEYSQFKINDPKPRVINKACVLDRFIHQAVFALLYGVYDHKFYEHSYSSRIGKGTHRAVKYLRKLCNKVSKNNSKAVWLLKCDVRKFFDSVDHAILKSLLRKRINDSDFLGLIDKIIDSFHYQANLGKGIPLGNVTSQIFTNIYLKELDLFVKHRLKIKNYIRYADDIIFIDDHKDSLLDLIPKLEIFLAESLALSLHPKKVILRPLRQGMDYLGLITFPKYCAVRTKTIKRMHKRLSCHLEMCMEGSLDKELLQQSLNSYLGLLSHANTFNLQVDLQNRYFCR